MTTATNTEASAATLPPVRGGVAPYLTVGGAAKAAEFYIRAVGAEEVYRIAPDDQGRTMHIHLYVNDGSLMLSDAYPEYGHPLKQPESFTLHLQVQDVDAWWNRAVEAGMEIVMPLEKQFWGQRYGQLRDPFGVLWSMGTQDG